MGSPSIERQNRSKGRHSSNDVLSDLDPAIIRNGQIILPQGPTPSRKTSHNFQPPKDLQRYVQIRDHAPDLWAFPSFKGISRSSRPEAHNGHYMNMGWYGKSATFSHRQNDFQGNSHASYRYPTTACDGSVAINNGQFYANHEKYPILEDFSSSGSSPRQIRGPTPNTQSTTSFSPDWSPYANSRPHGNISTQKSTQRRFSMESNYGRPKASYPCNIHKANNVFYNKGYSIGQSLALYDLQMARSRSLGSTAYQDTFVNGSFPCTSADDVTNKVTSKDNSDNFCDKHFIGFKRADIRTLWVTSIQNASEEEIIALFRPYGVIENIEYRNGATEGSRFAFIR